MEYTFCYDVFKYYRLWYIGMTDKQRKSFVGKWVEERILFYHQLLNDMAANVPVFNINSQIGNYKHA